MASPPSSPDSLSLNDPDLIVSDDSEILDEEVKKKQKPSSLRGQIPHPAEEALRHRLREYANKKCAVQYKSFAECTRDKFVSVVWDCADLQRELHKCLNIYSNETNLNKLRHAYLRGELANKATNEYMTSEVEKRYKERTQKL